MIIPVGLLAWLAIRGIGKIPNKTARIICYVLLVIVGIVVAAAMDEAGFKFCYKGHC